MVPGLPRGVSVSSSSSTEDLVDSILSQAMDQVALEQIASLNTAHLNDDNLLPDHLESRFRKLKSFPAAAAPERTFTEGAGVGAGVANEDRARHSVGEKEPTAPEKTSDRPRSDSPPPPPKRSPPPLRVEPGSVGDKDAHTPAAAADSCTLKHGSFLPSPPTASASRSRGSSHSPRPNYRSRSPPRGLACCFGLSPRSLSKYRTSGRRSIDGRSHRTAAPPRELNNGANKEWDLMDNDDLLADLKLGTMSIKEQGKRMKRALREQEKAAREAEKIVDWVRQASARIEFSAAAAGLDVDDLLSDEEKENRI